VVVRKPLRVSLAVALLAAASACAPGPFARRDPPVPAEAKANFVALTARTERVAFEPGRTALGGDRLRDFRTRMAPSVLGRGHLVLVAPDAPGDAVSEARADWTVAALQGAGVSVMRAAAPVSGAAAGEADRNGVTVEIQRARVEAPACEAYPRALHARVDETASRRPLGCATTANLGLMVAEPVDLVTGRSMGPADSAPTVKGVEKYRSGGAKADGGNPIAEAFAKAFGGKDK
jgi:pilus assembly protein CpaD